MAAKNCLTERLDVRDPSIQGNYHGKTAKNHDEDAHYDQPPDGKSERRVGELVELLQDALLSAGRTMQK